MRYVVGFAFVLALMASPLSVSAQDAEGAASAEPSLEEPAPSSEPATEEPASEAPDIDTLSRRTLEHYESRPWEGAGTLELRVKRAKTGLYVSAGAVGAGLVMAMVAGIVSVAQWGNDEAIARTEAALAAALAISSAGAIGMVTAGGILVHCKRKARKFERHETPRAQWDLARSRLVF